MATTAPPATIVYLPTELCPAYAPFFGVMGAASAIIFTCASLFSPFLSLFWGLTVFPSRPALGAAYGTAKSGVGVSVMAVMRPDLALKSIVPIVMAGIIAIYGLVVSVLIIGGCTTRRGTLKTKLTHESPLLSPVSFGTYTLYAYALAFFPVESLIPSWLPSVASSTLALVSPSVSLVSLLVSLSELSVTQVSVVPPRYATLSCVVSGRLT